MANNEKRYIPGTDPAWGKELPDGYDNSLVDKAGNAWDNGWTFDERSYDDLEEEEFDIEAAKKAREAAESDKKATD